MKLFLKIEVPDSSDPDKEEVHFQAEVPDGWSEEMIINMFMGLMPNDVEGVLSIFKLTPLIAVHLTQTKPGPQLPNLPKKKWA